MRVQSASEKLPKEEKGKGQLRILSLHIREIYGEWQHAHDEGQTAHRCRYTWSRNRVPMALRPLTSALHPLYTTFSVI